MSITNTNLAKEVEKLKTDKRLTDWNLRNGKFDKNDLKKSLDALPDMANNVDHFGLGDDGDEAE